MSIATATMLNIMEDAGEFIEAANTITGWSTTLDTQLDEIQAELATNGRHDVLQGVDTMFEGFKDIHIGMANDLGVKITQRMTHRDEVLEALALGGNASLGAVLQEMIRDLKNNTRTVNGSVLNSGMLGNKTTADGTGDQTLWHDYELDGVTPPGARFPAHADYNQVLSELALSGDILTVTCIGDSDTGGLPRGEELYIVQGSPPPADPLGWQDEGSGTGPTFPGLNAYTIINNKDFELWAANVPDGWTIDVGVAGTTVVEETTAGDVFRGDSALEFAHDGAEKHKLSQVIGLANFVPGKRYFFSCWIKSDLTGVDAGILRIRFQDTSDDSIFGQSDSNITLNAASGHFSTSYTEHHFYITIPDTLPDEVAIVIEWTTAADDATAETHLDSMAFGPVVYHGGVNFVVIAGAIRAVVNDRFAALTIAYDSEGVFQKFFRKWFGVQFPSNLAAGETYADSLAT